MHTIRWPILGLLAVTLLVVANIRDGGEPEASSAVDHAPQHPSQIESATPRGRPDGAATRQPPEPRSTRPTWDGPSSRDPSQSPRGRPDRYDPPPRGATRTAPTLEDEVDDIEGEVSSLEEEIEDLSEPVGEFELFDQCMHLIGVTEYGSMTGEAGYVFDWTARTYRPAFEMDSRGFDPPQYQFLAYPGEEPPSIECNEDAEARPEND